MPMPDKATQELFDTLLPRPRRIEMQEGLLLLNGESRIILSPQADPKTILGAERLATLVRDEYDVEWSIERDERCPALAMLLVPSETSPSDPIADGVDDASLPREGYILKAVPQGAVVRGSDPQGIFWGVMTLRQLVVRHEGLLSIPGVTVTDWPRYPWRGFQFDSGRSPNSMPKMKRIIRICSAFKLNFFVFREGDDELNAVRYQHLPLGSENPCALSLDQISDLIAYAEMHGVTLIPEIESLGHSHAKGRYYPDLVSGGIETEYEGIGIHKRKQHLIPGDDRSLALLEGIYREWLPILPSPYLHLGLDEVLIDRAPQALHMERLLPLIERLASEYGRDLKPIVWADAPPTPPEFADRIVRCLWAYGEHRENSIVGLANEHLVRQGIETLSSPRCSTPVLMAGGSGSKHTPHTKDTYEEAFANLASWARWGKNLSNFLGMFAVQWSGNMTDDWLPDFLTAADYAWLPPDEIPTYGAQMTRVTGQLQRLKDYTAPADHEVDPPAWDGIWLENKRWGREVLGSDGF